MNFLFEKLAKFAMLRAAVFGGMGIVTLLFPQFLRGAVFYAVVGYVLLCGIFGIADYFLCGKDIKAPFRYGTLAAAALMLAFGIFSIVYGRYLVHVAPLYLGGLMLVNGFVYFMAALCAKTRMQWLLTILSMLVLVGSGAIFIFTFGFEIVLTTSQASGIVLLLSCAYELAACLIYRKSNHGRMEREEMK